MPYIPKVLREELGTLDLCLTGPGEINYIISKICDDYISGEGLSYHTINTLIGALECSKLELYRRIAAPYEDKKKEEHGDVYTV